MSSFSSYCLPAPLKHTAWSLNEEKKVVAFRITLACEVKGAAEWNRSRGQERSTNTPHTHHLILGTENLIGWRSEEGQIAARTGGYCLPRKQVKRTQDSEAQVMNCKRYLVLSNLWPENMLCKWSTNTQFTAKASPYFP